MEVRIASTTVYRHCRGRTHDFQYLKLTSRGTVTVYRLTESESNDALFPMFGDETAVEFKFETRCFCPAFLQPEPRRFWKKRVLQFSGRILCIFSSSLFQEKGLVKRMSVASSTGRSRYIWDEWGEEENGAPVATASQVSNPSIPSIQAPSVAPKSTARSISGKELEQVRSST